MAVQGGMTQQEVRAIVEALITEYTNSELLLGKIRQIVAPEVALMKSQAEETVSLVKEEFVKVQELTNGLDQKIAQSAAELEKMRSQASQSDEKYSAHMQEVQRSMTEVQRVFGEVQAIHRNTLESIDQKANVIYAEANRVSQEKSEQVVQLMKQEVVTLREQINQVGAYAESRAPGMSAGPSNSQDLVSPKECPVAKISDGINVGDFKHWCLTFENHL